MIVSILVTAGLGVFFVAASGNVSCGAQSPAGSGSVHHGRAACGEPALVLGPGGEPVTDSFYFVHQPLAGNGSITVRVSSLTELPPGPMQPGLMPWSKAGIIIKQDLNPGSAYAAVMVTGGLVLAAGTVAVLACVLAGRLILPGRGFTPPNGYQLLSLANGPDLRAACGSVLYLALVALLSLGVASAVRDSAVAIGTVLALLYLTPIVAAVVSNQHWQRHLEQISPMTAGLYIQATVGVRALPLTPWQGLGVLALWAAGALILGALVLSFRDA